MFFALLRNATAERDNPASVIRGWPWLACRRMLLLSALLVSLPARGGSGLSERANAEAPAPASEGERAMPAFLHLGFPAPPNPGFATAATVGYGFMDQTKAVPGGHRGDGRLALATSPLSGFGVGIDFAGHIDRYAPELPGVRHKGYGEGSLNLRYAYLPTPKLRLGVDVGARLIGAEAPSMELPATSPRVVALLAGALDSNTWLGGEVGFMLDRSARAVPYPERLLPADERTLGASSYSALPWGIAVSHRLPRVRTELLAEVGGRLLIGGGAPSWLYSPAHAALGARYQLASSLSLQAMLEAALSKRTLAGADLIPIAPRTAGNLTVIWRFGGGGSAAAKASSASTEGAITHPKPSAPVQPTVELGTVSGTVVDADGKPLADVSVQLRVGDGEPHLLRTVGDGRFEQADVPNGVVVRVRVETPGFDTAVVELTAGKHDAGTIVLAPAAPAGQLRGRVLDYLGHPIPARVRVEPGAVEIGVAADGSFELELVPGKYTVYFVHPDFTDQKRTIRVRNRGVVIVDVAMSR